MRPLFVISHDYTPPETAIAFAKKLAIDMEFELLLLSNKSDIEADIPMILYNNMDELSALVEKHDAAMVIYELEDNSKIQFYLNKSRELRVPYLFVKTGQEVAFNHVAVPVTFLEEEKEKAPFAAAFGRFCKSQLTLVKPQDYGTKAQTNINAIKGLLDTFSLEYRLVQAKKDSFKVEKEVVNQATTAPYDMVIISASREYGLDDIIFGSKEKKILKKTQKPILVINPRADLYALCD